MKHPAASSYDLGPYYKVPEVSFNRLPLFDSLMRGSRGGAAALAVEQRTAETGERAITMLESKGIKVTLDALMKEFIKEDNGNSFIRGIAVRCKSWMCQDCRRRKGFEVRGKLIEKAKKFKEPRLLTLTVSRELFKSPEEAYHFVMNEKIISRLLTKEFGIRRWVWVLEAQEATGDGWPHWHILIDISDLKPAWYNKETKRSSVRKPKDTSGWCFVPHFLDLNRVHRLLRKWRVGEQCFLSERKADFKDSSHAIFYITKYLIKPPKKGFPKWMLDTPRLRFYQPSYDIGSIANESGKVKKEKRIKKHIATARKPSELIAECRKKTVFVQYDSYTGKHRVLYVGWGTKESLPFIKGAYPMQNFDFQTQKSYITWGFLSPLDLRNFSKFWACRILLNRLKNYIE